MLHSRHEENPVDFLETGLHIEAVRMLCSAGVVHESRDEFGDLRLELAPSAAAFRDAGWVTAPPEKSWNLPLTKGPAQHDKLELVLALRAAGWRWEHGHLDYFPDSDLVFSLSMVGRSKLYFAALLLAQDIWARGGADIGVRSHMPDNFYKCLLGMSSLKSLAAIPADGLKRMTNRHFAALLNGDELPPPGGDKHAALADADDGDADDPDGDEPPAVEIDGGPHLLRVNEGSIIREIDMRARQAEGFVIRYDGGSHASGIVRAYIKCAAHPRCFKYRQVNIDADARSRHAFLLAWVAAGPSVTREEHTDPKFAVSDTDLAAAYAVAPE